MTDPDRLVWDDMLAQLRSQHPKLCRQWFEGIEPVCITDGAVFVRAHNATHARYLRGEECVAAFNDAARTATGRLVGVRFLGPDDPAPELPAAPAASAPGNRAQSSAPASASTSAQQADTAAGRRAHGGVDQRPQPDRPRASWHGPDDREPSQPASTAVQPAAPDQLSPDRARPAIAATEAVQPKTGGTISLAADFDFDSFVVGPSNRLAHAASQAVSENPGQAYNPLFIHGGVGLGKTHLLQAIAGRVVDDNPKAMVHFDSCESFMNDFIESVQSGQMREFRHRFRDVDLLVIDDIHFLAKREHTQEEFFHTFNSLYAQKKQIVLSSDAAPEDIPDLENRLVSRFKWGLVATVETPGFDTRVAILRKKSSLRGFELPHQVAEYIAGRVTTNIRELEGAVLTLQMVASVADRPIDLEMAMEALGEPADQTPTKVPSIDEIISAVCERFDVKRTEILGKKRTRSITLPRHIAIYLARNLTRNSLQEIGGSFGGRDHTTVMHAIERAEAKRRSDNDLEVTIRQLEQQLSPGVAPAEPRVRG